MPTLLDKIEKTKNIESNLAKSPVQVTTFYRFIPLAKEILESLRDKFQLAGEEFGLRGLFLIGKEGVNATICGDPSLLERYKEFIKSVLNIPNLQFKDSYSSLPVFHLFKVKLRAEIVTLSREDIVPTSEHDHHISPEDWDQMLEAEDVLVLDTRNKYETEIGKFKNALDLEIAHFHQFPERVKNANLPKDKRYLIYCTGGIRCEKAILALREQGYKNVYQLNGGILNYFKERGKGYFEGECFVFDHRVAVDSQLQPSKKYALCPHCGQTAANEISCKQCGERAYVCQSCLEDQRHLEFQTCSKNCAHHFRLGHKTKRIHHDSFRKKLSMRINK